MKRRVKKLTLSRETVRHLDNTQLRRAAGAYITDPGFTTCHNGDETGTSANCGSAFCGSASCGDTCACETSVGIYACICQGP